MISQSDVRKAFEKEWNNDEDWPYMLDGDIVLKKNTGEEFSTIEVFTNVLRRVHHCDFECIYSCPGSLLSILRCLQCGTVIFASDDVEDYDSLLKCPTCGKYETHFEYWTKDDIDSDQKKQNTICFYEECSKEEHERYLREKRRHKRDDEILVFKHYGNKYYTYIGLKCNNLFHTAIKGLHLKIEIGKRENNNSIGYIMQHYITIPLSWSRFYIDCIYPYTKKCHPDLRKYFPWQKERRRDDETSETD